MRQTICERKTGETTVRVEINLDGDGTSDAETASPSSITCSTSSPAIR